MGRKLITWVDLENRFRRTALPYDDPANPPGETEEEMIQRVWAKVSAVPKYGLPSDHPYHVVEYDAQTVCLADCCELYFRYPVFADADNRRDGKDGAWEMGSDGLPTVNMTKARLIQMDYIRKVRNAELAKLDVPYMRAIESEDSSEQARIATEKQTLRDIPATFDITTGVTTPAQLKAKWPSELPARE